MNMTVIRKKSKIFLWICLIGFILSLVGVMGSAGGGFLGGASLTSFFSNSVNPALYVGKVGDKSITRRAFATELNVQRNTSTQFQISTSEQYYIGRAWEAIISDIIIDGKNGILFFNSCATLTTPSRGMSDNFPSSIITEFLTIPLNLFKISICLLFPS